VRRAHFIRGLAFTTSNAKLPDCEHASLVHDITRKSVSLSRRRPSQWWAKARKAITIGCYETPSRTVFTPVSAS